MKYRTLCAVGMVAIFTFYAYAQNNYFGWNRHPESDAELIADAIGYLMAIIIVHGLLVRGEE